METLKSTLEEKEEQWDRYLNQSSLFCKAERVTSIPKVYLSLAFASVVFLLLFLNVAGQYLSNLIGWVYPAYASFDAIEHITHEKRQQWLTYWVLLGLLQFIEYFEDTLLYWLPFYYLFKSLFILYLALPFSEGASSIYTLLLRSAFQISKSTRMTKAKQAVKRARSSIKKKSQ